MAAAVVNAMYPPDHSRPNTHYTGSKYAVLRSEFTVGDYQVNPDAQRVLILFGGTDPAGLTELAKFATQQWDVDVIAPGDDRSVAAAMHDADLLITSGGRTVFEAAAVGIPTIVMCQNMRETTHTHLGRGNLNLGLGRMVDPDRLTYVVQQTLEDYELRRDMSQEAKASIDGRGADRVRAIIEHVGYFGEKP
jgi:spore coat polysaccharide biosynthesis predicted glycosyltransferase SpsG